MRYDVLMIEPKAESDNLTFEILVRDEIESVVELRNVGSSSDDELSAGNKRLTAIRKKVVWLVEVLKKFNRID